MAGANTGQILGKTQNDIMETTKEKLLGVLDKALAESPREAAAREGRTLLQRIHSRFGPEVAQRYASRILSPGGRAEMKALLDGPAPAKAPAATPVKAVVPGLLPPPPPAPTKPTEPAVSTAVLKRILFVSVQGHLPVDFCAMDEDSQRRALLTAAWKSHCDTALPLSVQAELQPLVAGLRRRELTGSVRTEAAFRRETIIKTLKYLKVAAK